MTRDLLFIPSSWSDGHFSRTHGSITAIEVKLTEYGYIWQMRTRQVCTVECPVIPVFRYGVAWADWREVGISGGGRTERLTLEEGEGVIALNGQSDSDGWTLYLDVTTSTGRRWQHGRQMEGSDYSLRPSPALGGRLSHLSGRETSGDRVLCCHWTCG